MQQGVVIPAEKPQVGRLGLTPVGPVPDVVNVTPARVTITPFPCALAVPGYDGTPHSWGDHPGPSPHVDDLGVGAEDDAAHRCVTGQPSQFIYGEDLTILGLMRPSRAALEGGEVAENIDVRLLATNCRSVGTVEEAASQILESVVSALARCAVIVVTRWWHEGVQGTDERLSSYRRHPPVDPHHPTETGRSGHSPEVVLLGCRRGRARPIDRLSPVPEKAAGVSVRQVLGRLDQGALGVRELVGDCRSGFQQTVSLIGGDPGAKPRCEDPRGDTYRMGCSNQAIGPCRRPSGTGA
jgi:hypothetical protein